jgi:hypothetical protein
MIKGALSFFFVTYFIFPKESYPEKQHFQTFDEDFV